MDYAKIEARVLAHMALTCGLLLKAPRRQALYNFPVTRSGVLLDTSASPSRYQPPRSPRRWRFLSSRDTIERLAAAVSGLLPAEPLKRAAMHWRDIFEQDRERVSQALSSNLEHEARLTGRTVWMGGDYIDDGKVPTPEEAQALQAEVAANWRRIREALESRG